MEYLPWVFAVVLVVAAGYAVAAIWGGGETGAGVIGALPDEAQTVAIRAANGSRVRYSTAQAPAQAPQINIWGGQAASQPIPPAAPINIIVPPGPVPPVPPAGAPPAPTITQPGGAGNPVVIQVPATGRLTYMDYHLGAGYAGALVPLPSAGQYVLAVPGYVAVGQTINCRLSFDATSWGPEATLVVA